ncbi:hypothetical protein ACTFIZ_003190 [Dictyostelium cf. discoideum]
MKYLAIILILVSILSFSNAIATKHINARIYCGGNCQNSTKTSDITINVNECTLFSQEDTCGFPLPYFTAIPTSSLDLTYSVYASFGCNIMQVSKKIVNIGVCNTFTEGGFQFSILADPPQEGASNSNSLKPIILLSVLVTLIVSLML